ncbi:MAG: diguanylate cyclase [Polyangiaceae bacterium]|nr:diguanylate cyclase [Polyangiaceae bacterium]
MSDPWVAVSLRIQRALAAGGRPAVAAGFGGGLIHWAAARTPDAVVWAGLTLLAASTGVAVWRRLRRLDSQATTRLDLDLFWHLVVAAYAGVLAAPGGWGGPLHPVTYGVVMLAAAFCRPQAAIATVAFAVALDSGLGHVLGRSGVEIASHAGLLGLFATLNLLVFRAEITRIRKLSRARVEAELQRVKEAARSYRLIGAPQSAGPESLRAPPPRVDEERLLQSGVEEIHQAAELALELLRQALRLRTAALLWLDAGGRKVHVQELSTTEDAIAPGPFSARDGIVAAALARGEPVSVFGRGVASHVPYYSEARAVGAVCGAPLLEHGRARGVLVVDREAADPFTAGEEALLAATARFFLRAIENERVFVQLERAKSEQGKLYRATDALASATSEAEVVKVGVGQAREFASFDFAAVTLFDRASSEHEIVAVSGEGSGELVGQRFRHNQGLVGMAVANRHPLPYRGDYDPARQMVFTRRLVPPAVPSLLVLPLVVRERALGTLVLGSERKGTFGEAVRPILEVLASHVAVSLANARMMARLEELATTDGLTGLYNKRTLLELGDQKLKAAARFSRPLSVLVCDIDHFKKVNDEHGHDVGDLVIKGLGQVLQRVKRDTDIVARFGGEEFVVVCEQTDARGAELLAERIRTELESTRFHTDQGTLSVTCSVGAAAFPAAGRDWETLFKATDTALYASKRGGRNRVTLWTPKLASTAAA